MDNLTFSLPYSPPIIAPKGLLRSYCTTNTHVCYTDILQRYEDYRSFYEERIAKKEAVILDHSYGLNRIAPSVSVLVNWVRKLKPRVVILPDYNYQTDRTIKNSFKMLEAIEDIEVSTVGVLQGSSISDLERCYKAFKGRVSVIGLPAGIEKIVNRNDLVYILGIKQPCVFIEVFKSLYRERPRHSIVEMMWSSLPLRLAYLGEVYATNALGDKDFDFGSHFVPEHADINIDQYMRILTGELPRYLDPQER